ncbi:hypothetical protein C8Q75DRAFT_548169 [Abortiporus biennis]|nr:hypothetical protein C8Q75DRAFT_548169 [Abortiporus biennis]
MSFGGRLSVLSWISFFLLQFTFTSLVASQVQLNPNNFFIPITIRSPYFNTWTGGNAPMNSWEMFWSKQTTAWLGHVRVDGQIFQFLGSWRLPTNITNLTNVAITPTRTIFSFQAGPMNLTATFLTPIEPEDPVKQSLPFSYLSFEAVSTDGAGHSVQVYTDISAEWMSANGSNIVNWNTTQTAGSKFHTVVQQTPHQYGETNNQADDVVAYYAAPVSPSLTSQTGFDTDCRGQFDSKGFLTNSVNQGSGVIANPWPVFAHSVDLGTITQTSSPVVWAMGIVRNPSIQYTTPDGQVQNRSPYFASQGNSIGEIIDSVVNDFSSASQRADALDKKILDAASSITSNPAYAGLVSLATRQAWGATDLTVSLGTDGKWNTSDVKMFMKDIGTSRRVNAVEILYASFPAFLYVNATYAGYLLAPLLESQDAPSYGKPYAGRDLGESYPLAPGNNEAHQQGVEQSGNMLIMTLAHARISGDGTLINRHYNMLKGWADYLVDNSLTPTNQLNADSERQANLTNLAIKGIVGIKAMSEISQALNMVNDSAHYDSIATSYANQWQILALSSDLSHIVADYGDDGSWTLAYNLFADRLLQTKLVSDNIYQVVTQYYKSLATSSFATPFGLPIDSTITTNLANSAWTMFTAAVTTDTVVRDSLINPIWAHASTNNNSTPFPLQYRLDNGVVTGQSSPAQGSMLAPLALTLPNTTITVPPPSSASAGNSNSGAASGSHHTSIVGPVVGGVVGGLALIFLIILGTFFWRRRSRYRFHTPGTYVNYDAPKPTAFPPDSQNDIYGGAERGSSTQVNEAGQLVMTASPTGQTAQPVTVVLSSKAREAMMRNSQAAALNRAQYSNSNVTSAPSSSYSGNSNGSSRDPPTEAPVSPETQGSFQTDVRGLRAEMESLRRAMLEIQVERMEAPPTYEG